MVQVLIVDDHADMRRFLTVSLSPRWSVQEAWDGETALDWVRRYQPGVVLIAVSLAGSLSGLDLLSAIKSNAATQAIRVVMLAERLVAAEQHQAEQLGADAYFIKPLNPMQLTNWIQRHFPFTRLS